MSNFCFFHICPNSEALTFPKDFPHGRFHFGNTTIEVPITPSQYIHARLKCFDNRFAKNPMHIFDTLDWIERVAISNSINFFERKQFQEDITACEINSCTLQNMLSDDIMKASFKNIRGTPQYTSNMRSDTMAKNRNFTVYTFFSTFPQIIARQFGINLTDEDMKNMSTKERGKWLKGNPVIVARHWHHKYRVIFGRAVLMSGMHAIGQILNYDSKGEFQPRGPEHPHCGFHIMGAPRIDSFH